MHSKAEVIQQMFDSIEQWQQSGLTQKAYCLQNNIAYHVFHHYYRRYRSKDKEGGSSFIKLQPAPCFASAPIELVLADGKRILFHQGVSADYLKALMS